MEKLKEKIILLQELYTVTEDLLKATVNEDTDEINQILEKRQSIMDKVDLLHTTINNIEVENHEYKELDNKIKLILQKIIKIDDNIKISLLEKEREYRKKYLEVDIKLKTGNYDIDENDKKPKGYFLNTKS